MAAEIGALFLMLPPKNFHSQQWAVKSSRVPNEGKTFQKHENKKILCT